jgi:hypothetical protein
MSKEVVLKHSCMSMCWGTNGMVIRTGCEKGEELKGGRGRYEARKVKGAVSIITSNLAASATHHLVSAVPRI